MAKKIHLVLFFIAIQIGFIGILYTQAGCGVGAYYTKEGDDTGTVAGGPGSEGPLEDGGTQINEELPGTNIQDGAWGDLIITSALGQAVIVVDSLSDDEKIRVKNNLKNLSEVEQP